MQPWLRQRWHAPHPAPSLLGRVGVQSPGHTVEQAACRTAWRMAGQSACCWAKGTKGRLVCAWPRLGSRLLAPSSRGTLVLGPDAQHLQLHCRAEESQRADHVGLCGGHVQRVGDAHTRGGQLQQPARVTKPIFLRLWAHFGQTQQHRLQVIPEDRCSKGPAAVGSVPWLWRPVRWLVGWVVGGGADGWRHRDWPMLNCYRNLTA